MIVKNSEKGWEIITQTGHAYLAAQIVFALKDSLKGDYFLNTVLAAYNHETLETDFNEGAILNEKGMPLDFRAVTNSRSSTQKKVQAITTKISYRNSMVNALVAHHLLFLHRSILDQDLINHLDQIINRAAELYQVPQDLIDKMYDLLRFADRLSLMICCEDLPQTNRAVEINDALGKASMVYKSKNSFSITPWPFEKETLRFDVEYRLMESVRFSSEEQFIAEFDRQQILKRRVAFTAN